MDRTTHGPAKRLAAAFATLALAVAVPLVAAPAAQALSPAALILKMTNEYRASKGLSALHWNTGLASVAQSWSEEMLADKAMSHNPTVFSDIPSGWTGAAENVGYACGYSSATAAAKAIVAAWKKSPGHDANLRGAYGDLGVGFAWSSATHCAYTTQDFAKYTSSPTKFSIFGTVVNSGGTAAAGATVTATSSKGSWSTKVDSTGSYQLTGLAKGTYVLRFTPSATNQRTEFYTDAEEKACATRISLTKDKVGLTTKFANTSSPTLNGDVTLCDIAADPASSDYTVFANEIQWLADEGVTTGWPNGYGASNYRPLNLVTREQMAAFLYRMAGEPSYSASGKEFADFSSSPFKDEIAWLAKTGVTTGWANGDGTSDFRPTASVNRDVMAAFLYRYAGSPSYTPPAKSPFKDVPTTHVFYKEICWLAAKGISKGWTVSNGKEYRPTTAISREQMAAFLFRYDSSVA